VRKEALIKGRGGLISRRLQVRVLSFGQKGNLAKGKFEVVGIKSLFGVQHEMNFL